MTSTICAMCACHAAETHHPRSSELGSTEVNHPRKVNPVCGVIDVGEEHQRT